MGSQRTTVRMSNPQDMLFKTLADPTPERSGFRTLFEQPA
jgi:hypothetical protein